MARYAIGDVQGCFRTLNSLLDEIEFDPAEDRLTFLGDLVNRGSDSLATLRWVYAHRDVCDAVLGNHDIHLLARGLGVGSKKNRDTLDQILEAPDRDELLSWLRARPFMIADDDYLFVHAGLLPKWSVDKALERAQEAQATLGGPEGDDLIRTLRDRKLQQRMKKTLLRAQRTIRVVTQLRYVNDRGEPVYGTAGPPSEAAKGLYPWFSSPVGKRRDRTVVFGHWATLGLHQSDGFLGLDTGCVWGGSLSAVRLDDRTIFTVPTRERTSLLP